MALDTPLEWGKFIVGALSVAGGIGIGYWLKDKIYELMSAMLILIPFILAANMATDESNSSWFYVIGLSLFFGFFGMLIIYPIFAMRRVRTKIDMLEGIINKNFSNESTK
jgi:predicted MFS family arabinose efflux permease